MFTTDDGLSRVEGHIIPVSKEYGDAQGEQKTNPETMWKQEGRKIEIQQSGTSIALGKGQLMGLYPCLYPTIDKSIAIASDWSLLTSDTIAGR